MLGVRITARASGVLNLGGEKGGEKMNLMYVLNSGQGQSSCALCSYLGIWNRTWSCFLGKLENLPYGDLVGKSLCPECAAFVQHKYENVSDK